LARRFGLLRSEVRPVEGNITQVRDEVGDMQYYRAMEEARATTRAISARMYAADPLIQGMAPLWAPEKVVRHFDRTVQLDVLAEYLRMDLAAWIMQHDPDAAGTEGDLLIRRRPWFSHLEERARGKNVRLVGYGNLWGLAELPGSIARLASMLSKGLVTVARSVCRHVAGAKPAAPDAARVPAPPPAGGPAASPVPRDTVAVNYGFRKISFDPGERSELFMLEGSGVSHDEVLVYNYVSSRPLDAGVQAEVNRRGIRLLGSAPHVAAWRPTWCLYRTLLNVLGRLAVVALGAAVRRGRASPFCLRRLFQLAKQYAYWYDFYAANHVRVDVGTCHTSVAQVLALDALGGVSIAYQYSPGVIVARCTHSAGEDVQFVFSELFERVWRAEAAPVGRFVRNGFIYDRSSEYLRHLGRGAEVRKRLQEAGARFILCFFDENSYNRWDILRSHEQEASDYEYVLRWLLEDSTIGVVCKPKASRSLLDRLGHVAGLLEQAKRTGRCVVLTSDEVVSTVFPAEAALASDLCIGKIFGAAAALEGRLAGVRAVLLDDGLSRHPFYAWGRHGVIFSTWPALRAAVERFRAAPDEYPEFGDWSAGLPTLDPFCDGQAGLRLGTFIHGVHEALKAGRPKQQALEIAGEKFAGRWGAGAIVVNRPASGGVAASTLAAGGSP